MSSWTIDADKKYLDELSLFIDFSENMKTNFFLNLKNPFCLVEKILYDNISFHSKRFNIDLKDKYVSFWTKKREYNFDHIHTHIDHCDYEYRMYGTQKKHPIFTSLIYLSDNECPTLITDITREMADKKSFLESNKLTFSFPKVFKNIAFESGKYYHGESYLADYKVGERKTIVIAVWDKENKPLHIPYFDKRFYYYYLFTNKNRPIEQKELFKYNKIPFFKFKKRDEIILKINDTKLINEEFFNKLIIQRDKKIMYRFFDLLKNVSHDTIVLDYSSMIKNPYENMRCSIEVFKINDNNENLEKYVYGISMFHIKRLGLNINDIDITYKIATESYVPYKNGPIMSSVTFLEDSTIPFSIIDMDYESYKYKNFEDTKMFLFVPKKMINILFSGGFYSVNNALIINFWKKNAHNETICKLFEGNEFTLNKINDSPTHLYTNEELFEEVLYKKNVEVLNQLDKMLEIKLGINILNIACPSDKVCENKVCQDRLIMRNPYK